MEAIPDDGAIYDEMYTNGYKGKNNCHGHFHHGLSQASVFSEDHHHDKQRNYTADAKNNTNHQLGDVTAAVSFSAFLHHTIHAVCGIDKLFI